MISYFEIQRPEAKTELIYHENPFQLLVAVILSAQCTDKRVNMITPALFAAFPTPEKMAEATKEDIFAYVHSVSYPNAKSEHLSAMAQKLMHDFGGEVPDDVDALQTLPGVGRKTANVVCSVVFHQPRMAVDTHVFRVANRIGLTHHSKTPLQTELELTKHIPEKVIPIAHHWLILHGRYVCTALRPHCDECGISAICDYYRYQETAAASPHRERRKAAAGGKKTPATATKTVKTKSKTFGSSVKSPAAKTADVQTSTREAKKTTSRPSVSSSKTHHKS